MWKQLKEWLMSAISDAVAAMEKAWGSLKNEIVAQEPEIPPTSPPPTSPPPVDEGLPTATKQPRFAPTDTIIAGQTYTRVPGEYPGGTPIEGRRFRDGQVLGDDGARAAYAVPADAGGSEFRYEELVESDATKKRKWFISTTVKAVADAPSSSPTPPPAPSPSPSGRWTNTMIDEAIRQMTAPNQGLIANVPNGKPGWTSRGSVVMGNRWTDEGAASWAITSGQGPNYYWPKFNFWAVLFTEIGNTAEDGFVEVMEQQTQLLYRNANSWVMAGPKNGGMGWGEHFGPDMITSLGHKIEIRPGTMTGAMSFQLPKVGAPHWIDSNGEFRPSNIQNLEGVMTSMLIRIDPRGNPNVRCLAHVGGDPKPDNRLGWYPGFGVSSVQKVAAEWRRISCINIEGAVTNYTGPDRLMTQVRLRACPPLL